VSGCGFHRCQSWNSHLKSSNRANHFMPNRLTSQ
jgi:hypothetical protein